MNLFPDFSSQNLLPKNGEVYFYENYLTQKEATDLFNYLKVFTSWQKEEITIFGKKILSPRLTAYYGEKEYAYSGVVHQVIEYPGLIKKLIDRINNEYQNSFNSVLLNYYRNGQDSMGWHQDNEPELGKNPTIASLNLGATRKFSFKHIVEKERTLSLPLTNGSLLLMKGETQHNWKHQLPKTKKIVGERINLTFREIKPEICIRESIPNLTICKSVALLV
ncbi:MAG: alpha-ketoglutarate-dependent dioxygenase AlkB [Cyclobacteriaceae bacterium]